MVGLFASYNWLEEKFVSSRYQAPLRLEMSAEAKDIIHSEPYTNQNGERMVKYAYLKDEVPPLENEDLGLRTPGSQTIVLKEFKNEKGEPVKELQTIFLPKPQFYQDGGSWRQIEYATTTEETFSMSGAHRYVEKRRLVERLLGVKPVFAVTDTFLPDPSVESTSVDGQVDYSTTQGGGCNWSAARDIATGSVANDSSASLQVGASSFYLGDPIFQCYPSISRVFLLFDTSSLPNTASISSASLTVYITGKGNDDDDTDDTLSVVTSTPASNTALVTADFDQLGTTLQATAKDITDDITASADAVFTLNSTGRGNISLTSITKFGLREGHDLGNTQPFDGSATGNYVVMYSADQTGTADDPVLSVTYTVPSTASIGQWFPF
jgi:hypothetical protein